MYFICVYIYMYIYHPERSQRSGRAQHAADEQRWALRPEKFSGTPTMAEGTIILNARGYGDFLGEAPISVIP